MHKHYSEYLEFYIHSYIPQAIHNVTIILCGMGMEFQILSCFSAFFIPTSSSFLWEKFLFLVNNQNKWSYNNYRHGRPHTKLFITLVGSPWTSHKPPPPPRWVSFPDPACRVWEQDWATFQKFVLCYSRLQPLYTLGIPWIVVVHTKYIHDGGINSTINWQVFWKSLICHTDTHTHTHTHAEFWVGLGKLCFFLCLLCF